jgi:TolB-like protein/DNA-binding winged helix-turn-helix (wHTH) protein
VIADFGGETLRTNSGDSVELRPQAFAVLRHLADHVGQVVTKSELMRAVWPGIAVTDDSLVQCIHEIRRALRDDERALLKTVPKRGYRLVLPAVAGPDTPEDQQPVEAGTVGNDHGDGSPGVAPASGEGSPRVSIAVLPFVNMSSDPEQEYFSDGITEDITTDLSRWQSFAVASRNSASRFKGRIVDIRAAGRELGADFLVEGSVRRVGDRIRITAQLIDARTGYHVWAERFDRSIADLFVVQDEVVKTIVGTLVGRVYASTADHLRRKPPSSPAAYDLTMRGNWLAWDEPASRVEAKRCFEQAIALDSGYGLPHSLLALMLVYDWHLGFSSSPEALDRAFALAKRGVELADNEGTSHVALSFLYQERRSFELALRHMERAVEINPANPATQADFGILLSHIGRAEEALERFAAACRADPYFGPSWYMPAVAFAEFVLRRYADALRNFDRGSTGTVGRLGMMAGCCAKLGLSERARDLVAKCLALQPEATIGTLVARIVFKDAGDSAHFAECLRLAGMPE